MKIEGRVFKNKDTGKFYAVEVPALSLHTQSRTLKEAYEMAKEAIEIAINKTDFTVEIIPAKDGIFHVRSSNLKYLLAGILRSKRLDRGLTASQVATAMNEKSVTGYLRYERAESEPSMNKFTEILLAMDSNLEPVLKIG